MQTQTMRRVLVQDIERCEDEALLAANAFRLSYDMQERMRLADDYACAVASLARKIALFERS